MAEPVEIDPCPSCGVKVGVEVEDIGKDVSCPYCNSVFKAKKMAKAKPRPVRDDELDEDDRPNRRRRDDYDDEDDRPSRRRGNRQPRRESKRVVAGVLALLLGFLGVHKFYLGYTSAGLLQILLSCFGVGKIIAIIEGIIYLTKTDEEFYEIYERGEKHWF